MLTVQNILVNDVPTCFLCHKTYTIERGQDGYMRCSNCKHAFEREEELLLVVRTCQNGHVQQ
jgi:ribosomal protein L37AE/L43A